ncbi:MAG: C40 family peptidase [Saprospiraceae bacterium]|nr:C40 family peptidase [Saprospiraceae bacterium]
MKKSNIIFKIGCICLIISLSGCAAFQPMNSSKPTSISTGESQLRSDIVTYARKFQGAKYKYAGMSPNGFDCSGFTCYVMNHHDIKLTHQSGVQETEGRVVSEKDAQPGDLVFFRKRKGGDVFHVALIISNGPDGIEVIHATSSRGVVIDNIRNSSYWSTKYATIRNVIDP